MARMQLGCFLLGLVFLIIGFALSNSKADDIQCEPNFNRSSFPEGFLFGTATSSYQYEGAANEEGRGPSVWDWYSHEHADRIADGSNGDVAVDHYHRYEEDVKIMKDMDLDAYRFSISWSRLLPNGKLSGGINQKGIQFYNDLIDEILRNGLQPYVTLFHWDMPQTLTEEYGGFLSYRVVEDFKNYAELCFKEFGDRVKHWITLNEPHTFAEYGYASGLHAPGRCSDWQNLNCTGGDSGTEPYLVAHYALLAHAHAVKLYKDSYKENQKGVIGITILTFWYVPASEEIEDIDAASRSLDFMFGWYIDPLTTGDYPRSMRFLVGERLPKFTKEESELLTGSYDFLGLNYYTARYASNEWECHENKSYLTDVHAKHTTELDGVPIGPPAASAWLYVYPRGIYDFILHVKNNYNNPIIYITENGIDEFNIKGLPLEQALNDTARIEYYSSHLCYVQAAIEAGANVKGYFAWSLLDNYEWHNGFSVRFGIHFIDYEDGLKRYPKWSVDWFKKFLTKSTKNAGKISLSDNNWDTKSVHQM